MFPFSEVMYEDTGIALVGAFAVVYIFIMLFMFAAAIAMYVLEAVGLYTIAKRRRLRNPWLAWIPVGNVWIMGSLSDHYKKEAKGLIKNRRKLMMGLYIAMYALLFVFFFCFFAGGIIAGMTSESVEVSPVAVLLILAAFAVYFAVFAVAIAASVFMYMCCYDIFMSCEPDNAVLFLVLGIVFNVTLPVFLFINRNKDKGLPAPAPVPPADGTQV